MTNRRTEDKPEKLNKATAKAKQNKTKQKCR